MLKWLQKRLHYLRGTCWRNREASGDVGVGNLGGHPGLDCISWNVPRVPKVRRMVPSTSFCTVTTLLMKIGLTDGPSTILGGGCFGFMT